MLNIKKISTGSAKQLLTFLIAVIFFSSASQAGRKGLAIQKCLIISDIHFSPLFGASLRDTVLKGKLERATFDEWKKYFENSPAQMTLNTNLLFQDANYALLHSALYNMKQRLPHPAFIVIAGDFIWHGATPADSGLKKKTILFIARLFKENFPNTIIVPAMGNNDTYGNDYDLQDLKFLTDFARAWEPNLPKSAGNALTAQGYYTCETANLRLLVINSALVSKRNDSPQGSAMWKWLAQNLSHTKGKNIWIITHIPPGLNEFSGKNFWNEHDEQVFVHTIVKFAPAMKFMIAGHTHFNNFKVIYNGSKNPMPVSFMRIVPSICANHGNYPSFEVAEFDSATGCVNKETNWYLNLAAVSKGKGPDQVIWADTLGLPLSLKLDKMDARGFSKLINNIKKDKTGQLLKSYTNFYNAGNNADSSLTINHKSSLRYLKADSLMEKQNKLN